MPLPRSPGTLRVDFVPIQLEDEALRWLRQHDEREYLFVDVTSFAYMRCQGNLGGVRLLTVTS